MPEPVIFAMRFAVAETTAVAPAIARVSDEMSAPRVTVSALMHRPWSQPASELFNLASRKPIEIWPFDSFLLQREKVMSQNKIRKFPIRMKVKQ